MRHVLDWWIQRPATPSGGCVGFWAQAN